MMMMMMMMMMMTTTTSTMMMMMTFVLILSKSHMNQYKGDIFLYNLLVLLERKQKLFDISMFLSFEISSESYFQENDIQKLHIFHKFKNKLHSIVN